MSSELLAKEKEFYRLNKELEQKTRVLIKEVDFVINAYGENVPKTNFAASSVSQEKTEIKIVPLTNGETKNKFGAKSCRQKQIVQSMNPEEKSEQDAENDTVNKFLQSKIKMLHEELYNLKLEYTKQSKNCKDSETEYKKLDESKKKLMSQISSLRETLSKFETANAELQTRFEGQSTEILALKKETCDLKKESRTLNQQIVSNEVRFQRSLEDNEKLRSTLKLNQLEEKELRDQIRKLQNNKVAETKHLNQQKSELLKAFKKQMHLVDNLKKQNAYLEAMKNVQLNEADFSKFLEWKADQA